MSRVDRSVDDFDLHIDDGPPPDDPFHAADDAPGRDRRRIDGPERRKLDNDLAGRLDGMGLDPWLPNITTMDLLETGESFDVLPLREHWIFAGTAKRKAADFVKHFTAFAQQADTSRFRGYVLRPTSGKGSAGQLLDRIRQVSQVYGNVMTAAVADGIGRPVATFVHPRFDVDMKLWDVHLHVVIDVESDQSEKMFDRLCRNFSTPKIIQPMKSVGAWVNYCATWTIDHRDISNWPTWAVKEFWVARRLQLQRKVGAFAAYCQTVKGKALVWEGGQVLAKDRPVKPSRKPAQTFPGGSSPKAIIVAKVHGMTQLVAISKRPRLLDGDLGGRGPASRVKPTTSTVPIPTTPLRASPRTTSSHRLRQRILLWEKIWPYGVPGRPTRPVKRRTVRFGADSSQMRPKRHYRT